MYCSKERHISPKSGTEEQPHWRYHVALNLLGHRLELQLDLVVDGSLIFLTIDDWLARASQSQPVWFL